MNPYIITNIVREWIKQINKIEYIHRLDIDQLNINIEKKKEYYYNLFMNEIKNQLKTEQQTIIEQKLGGILKCKEYNYHILFYIKKDNHDDYSDDSNDDDSNDDYDTNS